MSITGAGSITAANVQAVNNMNNQLDQLSEELGTGDAAQTYSGLGSQAGIALALRTQLSAIDGYSSTASSVGITLSVAQSALTQIGDSSSAVGQSVGEDVGTFTLDGDGQTPTQSAAVAQLGQMLSALNTQVGDNYIFSGSAVNQPAVASESAILNGTGTQAGLTQVIAERQQADVGGANDPGRLSTSTSGSQVTIAHDTSSFGFQLSGITSDSAGVSISEPSGSPPQESINFVSNPNAGDTVYFTLTMPDGSTQTVALTATTSSPPGTNQFTIGTTPSDTAANLQTTLNSALTDLTQTALPAASAIEAANNFFSSDPPQRVDGPPFDTATSLVNGTSANTVFWYTGGSSNTPRQTAVAQVGPSTTIAYGMQANEPAISAIIANVAALAAVTYSASDPNAQASYTALGQQVAANLSGQSGTQSISDIEADLANAQTTMTNAGTVNTQTQTTLQDMLQSIEGVNQDQIGEQILTLQNSLSASLSVTARLAQISLVNYLAASG